MRGRGAILALAMLAAPAANAAQPRAALRIWGPPEMTAIAQRWADAYARLRPGTQVVLTMRGSDTAIPGLYGGLADIALMGRIDDEVDDNGFSRPLGHPFTRLELTRGALDAPGKSPAIVVLVNRANPLARMTLAELDAVMSCERRRGHAPIRTWGDLGVAGALASRPIRVLSFDLASGTGVFFQHAVDGGSRKMNWATVTEYRDADGPGGDLRPAAQRAAEAAGRDPSVLVIGALRYAGTTLRPLALAETAQGPFVTPSEASVASGAYPLARTTYAFIDRRPSAPVDPDVEGFLSFALSPEGQAMLIEDHGYLPLRPEEAAEQLEALRRP